MNRDLLSVHVAPRRGADAIGLKANGETDSKACKYVVKSIVKEEVTASRSKRDEWKQIFDMSLHLSYVCCKLVFKAPANNIEVTYLEFVACYTLEAFHRLRPIWVRCLATGRG